MPIMPGPYSVMYTTNAVNYLTDICQRPSQIRQMLEDEDMPVDDAPADEGDGAPRQSYNFAPGYHGVVYRADVPDRGAGTGSSARGAHGSGASASADTNANAGAVAAMEQDVEQTDDGDDDDTTRHIPPAREHAATTSNSEKEKTAGEHYKLQAMKWGLVPFWTKRNPDYASMLKTINCRDDSLASPGGMWASMKARKRCIVLGEGFYEW